jgi:UbiA prenyltransferase family
MLKPWLELARISNLPTAWTNVLAGWLLAGGNLQDHRLLWLLLGGSLLYSGGMILNDVFDAEWDRAHGKGRPIPSGRVSRRLAAWVGSVSLVSGCLTMFATADADGRVVLALLIAILGYNWLHKRWAGSVLLMGSCRMLLYWAAGSGVHGEFDLARQPLLVVGGIAMGIYIVGITMVARFESRSDMPKPAMAWLSRELLYAPGVLLVLIPNLQITAGWKTAAPLIFIAFVVLIRLVLPMIRKGGADTGKAVGWLLAGICIVDGMALCTVSVGAAFWIAALTPALRLWQRKIAAT